MLQAINTKILLSAAVILAAAAVIVGATFAFFADTETSTANTLAAGELDLKVDSEAHYNGLICTPFESEDPEAPSHTWQIPAGLDPEDDALLIAELEEQFHFGQGCVGTWTETDLTVDNVFFALNDVKPGDTGENTISLHVYNNDAWGRMVVNTTEDSDNGCTEPETESSDPECSQEEPPAPVFGDGELRENLEFTVWLDQGETPGFQCNSGLNEQAPGASCPEDLTEGDNVHQPLTEPIVISAGEIDINPENETFEFAQGLATIYANTPACAETPTNGNNNYGPCHGLAADGRMVGSTTYYLGVLWTLPGSVGNEAQSDRFMADVAFQVVQHRNNPTPTFPAFPAE